MKLLMVSIGAWLGGLLVFLGGIGLVLNDELDRFVGLLALFSLGASVVTVAALYAPAMLALRSWAPHYGWKRYVAIGGLVGLLPGVVLGTLAGAIGNIDGAAKSLVALLISPSGVVTCVAGICSGVIFAAGFFAAFIRRSA